MVGYDNNRMDNFSHTGNTGFYSRLCRGMDSLQSQSRTVGTDEENKMIQKIKNAARDPVLGNFMVLLLVLRTFQLI